jgi:hypothetical protein
MPWGLLSVSPLERPVVYEPWLVDDNGREELDIESTP